MTDTSDGSFSVLAVCTGNICRSPAAERLLRSAIGTDRGIAVSSAGTGALVGQPVHEPMAELLHGVGVGTEGFAARRVTQSMVRDADLVLALTRAHRAAAVDLWPAAVRRAFTLREFARLGNRVDGAELEAQAGPGAGPARRLAALVPLAAAHRAQVPAELDDVVDPYKRTLPVYEASFDQILAAVQTVARLVLGAEGSTGA
ncbi:low molecular weight phosphatase family protein [Georgenia sp. SYP-B2076]|uniref:arsenate reductase/protein-tyrosine-phosphatase family protein n=1 Tax=Georgenia sp. SYP-B2076 TaxID=2495881 RepID=UPI001F0C530B|nr:low molecular weight phosphatase family protein [Georgenia sp. SYP-B2076]